MGPLSRRSSRQRALSASARSIDDMEIRPVPMDPNDLELGPSQSSEMFSSSGNLVIPHHLLEYAGGGNTSRTGQGWDPDLQRSRQSSAWRDFDVVRIAQAGAAQAAQGVEDGRWQMVEMRNGRASSITLGERNRRRTSAQGHWGNELTLGAQRLPLRKTSLPAIAEKRKSVATVNTEKTLSRPPSSRTLDVDLPDPYLRPISIQSSGLIVPKDDDREDPLWSASHGVGLTLPGLNRDANATRSSHTVFDEKSDYDSRYSQEGRLSARASSNALGPDALLDGRPPVPPIPAKHANAGHPVMPGPSNEVYGAAGSTVLFQKLSKYSMANSSKTYVDGEAPIEALPPLDKAYIMQDEKLDDFAPEDAHAPPISGTQRHDTIINRLRQGSVLQVVSSTIANAAETAAAGVANVVRKSSLADVYERAKAHGQVFQRKEWVQTVFEYSIYLLLICFIYFVLVGRPLWNGAVWWLYWVVDHKFVVAGTWAITIGLAAFYAYAPLIILFEKEPPMPADTKNMDPTKTPGVYNTALLIPCYKSAKIIGPTLDAALKVFPPSHVYVIANGNSPVPLDNTEEVCRPYGVNHIWSPVGSKIVAQFVGCYAAKHFENVLLIDDDCALPPNFPIVSERMKGKVQCIGYTIKSVGPNSSRGTFCQQAQDLEYKISGLQRQFAGMIGSATFPHGAISLWNTKFLIKTFYTHPGFSVSEDWFFGHVARELGCRIKMCSAIFVETETPTDVFFAGGGSRGGFGEMTIFKQRFYRWNFFFVNGMYYNLKYILTSWKLGWWEIGAKIFVWQEVYETLLYLLAPFVLPISFVVRPSFCGYLTVATFVLYYINVTIFNEIHLRLRNERVGLVALYIYYAPYKMVLTLINIFSCYWALYKYARYFAKKHPKVIEDEKAVEVVFRLEESAAATEAGDVGPVLSGGRGGRRLTVTAVGTRVSISGAGTGLEPVAEGTETVDFGHQRQSDGMV